MKEDAHLSSMIAFLRASHSLENQARQAAIPTSLAALHSIGEALGSQFIEALSLSSIAGLHKASRSWRARFLKLHPQFHGCQEEELCPLFYSRHPQGLQGPGLPNHVSYTLFSTVGIPTVEVQ